MRTPQNALRAHGTRVRIVAIIAALSAAGALGLATPPRAGATDQVRSRSLIIASAGGIDIAWRSRGMVGVGYHESLFRTAMPLTHRRASVRGFVMDSRGRGTGPRTAADVVIRRGRNVGSPVGGRIVDVTHYRLYCAKRDVRVIIKPSDKPRRRVVLFHLAGLRIEERDRVAVGDILGRPRFFPNSPAQYDDYVGGDHPHVHVEVERRPVRPLPGCR